MKTSQWIGVLIVLVVMVFVITIAKNFLGDTRTPIVTTTTQPNAAGPESASPRQLDLLRQVAARRTPGVALLRTWPSGLARFSVREPACGRGQNRLEAQEL